MRLLLLCAVPLLAQKIVVMPATVELTGPEARQQMIAEGALANHQEDWTKAAEWTSSDPKIAAVDNHGLVRPVSDGEVKITARAKGMSATASVRVKDSHAPREQPRLPVLVGSRPDGFGGGVTQPSIGPWAP